MDIVQFNGRRFHKDCFDAFLQNEKVKNKLSSDFVPRTTLVDESDLSVEDACEHCSSIFLKEDQDSETPTTKDDDEDKDDTVDTPSKNPRRRPR